MGGMRGAHKGRAKPNINECTYIQAKSTYTIHYLADGPTDTHTHTHPKNRTKWSLFGPPARRTVGLKTRVCLGPVHLVWSLS